MDTFLIFITGSLIFFNNKLWVRLICALMAHIKLSIFGNIFSGIEKTVNTFSIFEKFFPKMINYCVPLGHTLAKSINYYGYSRHHNNNTSYSIIFGNLSFINMVN